MFTAFVYRGMTAGFADYLVDHPTIPGPMLQAEVGDVLVVHFRNADTELRQAVTMHPHGVKYNPEYDGAYMGEFTRDGGFVAPGESFTYQWECTPDSVGAWPYHDHGPNHTLNSFRGLFGAIIVRAKGEKRPDRVHNLFAHQLSPPVTRLERNFHCFNGRAYAGNTPTLTRPRRRGRRGQRLRQDSNFHTFHIHGHRWKDAAGAFTDNPGFGPNESITGPLRRGQPGPLALPLPRLHPSGRGHGGLVPRRLGERCAASPSPRRCLLLAPAAAAPRRTPSRRSPAGRREAERPASRPTRSARAGQVRLHHDPEGRRQGEGGRHDPRPQRHLPGGRARSTGPRSAT